MVVPIRGGAFIDRRGPTVGLPLDGGWYLADQRRSQGPSLGDVVRPPESASTSRSNDLIPNWGGARIVVTTHHRSTEGPAEVFVKCCTPPGTRDHSHPKPQPNGGLVASDRGRCGLPRVGDRKQTIRVATVGVLLETRS